MVLGIGRHPAAPQRWPFGAAVGRRRRRTVLGVGAACRAPGWRLGGAAVGGREQRGIAGAGEFRPLLGGRPYRAARGNGLVGVSSGRPFRAALGTAPGDSLRRAAMGGRPRRAAVGGRPFRTAMGASRSGRRGRYRRDSGAALAGPGRFPGRGFGRARERAPCPAVAACRPAAKARRPALAVGLATLAVAPAMKGPCSRGVRGAVLTGRERGASPAE
jgi:hypothetical protein